MLRSLVLGLVLSEVLCTISCTSTGTVDGNVARPAPTDLKYSTAVNDPAAAPANADNDDEADDQASSAAQLPLSEPTDRDFVPPTDGSLVGARCPTPQDFAVLLATIEELGEETRDLVKEDIESLTKISRRSDLAAISSCCSLIEQMIQDVEIMNEDRPAAEGSLEKLRQIDRSLCFNRRR